MRIIFTFSILIAFFLISCGTAPKPLHDDAVRIKLDSVELSDDGFNPYVEPNTGKDRNPNTLR